MYVYCPVHSTIYSSAVSLLVEPSGSVSKIAAEVGSAVNLVHIPVIINLEPNVWVTACAGRCIWTAFVYV